MRNVRWDPDAASVRKMSSAAARVRRLWWMRALSLASTPSSIAPIVHTVPAVPISVFAFAVFYFTYSLLVGLAGSADPLTWTGRRGLAAIGMLALLAGFGLYASLGRRLVRPRTAPLP